ncbi:hypothetical protein QE152_g25191 [Popillia japonica]|uniref:Fibronectin type-III domain-containing protein n=1 Tax=Popillia japonica TaxID=7064 RepID=A0AAW1K2G4_POPJA
MTGKLECNIRNTDCDELEITIDIRVNSVEVTWTLIDCAFIYIVTHFVNGVQRSSIYVPHPIYFTDVARVTCSRNRIVIEINQPTGIDEPTPPTKNFVVGLEGSSAVENLKFIEESGRFEWNAPDNSEGCELQYRINYRNEIATNEIITDDLFYKFPLYFCSSNEIIVTTIIGIEDVDGESVSSIYPISTPDLKEVQDLRFDEDLSRFQWNPPDKSQICGLEYEIEFQNQADSIEAITSEEFYNIFVHPCSSNTISVITLVGFDNSQSQAVIYTHDGPVTRQLPIHIKTNPQENSAQVTWNIPHESFNFCQVDELRYEVVHLGTGDQTIFSNDFEEGTDVDFLFTSLEVDQEYQYRLCYVFSTLDIICSTYITFITHPLAKPIITAEINADENIEISWDQTYYSSFVTGHTLIIEPMEPNHFVPSQCYFDKTQIEIRFGPDATSYIFENFIASFKYRIQVITHFDELGMTTSDEDIFATNEATPGQLNVHSSYQFGYTLSYDASLLIKLNLPCDINGKLQQFAYKVTSVSDPDFVSMCNDIVVASGIITVEGDVQETYDVPVISRIFPFFKYTIEVTTYLENHIGVTLKNLGDPPQAYTPPY